MDFIEGLPNSKKKDCIFVVVDRLSNVARNCQKLAPRWFGSFLITDRVGKVAYRLELPIGSRVHIVFHVSQLKKQIGNETAQPQLPLMDSDGSISKEPVKILDLRIGKRGIRATIEVLVEWTNSFPEDAT
ncbi:hypothetical protein HRI_003586700 [Hibiscus trionum]|uniref:Tf2-1-like SH3-like domain-containing protein n=1 Tax=Hibiscus trionum TaxID=183268 RepID=A0A9W7IN78_HIBTR|nr:hypothetical protein HRI_003586700 [Hibiscus trionum]